MTEMDADTFRSIFSPLTALPVSSTFRHLSDRAHPQASDEGRSDRKGTLARLRKLPPLLRNAAILDVLNAQVHNGGFQQWFDNQWSVQ